MKTQEEPTYVGGTDKQEKEKKDFPNPCNYDETKVRERFATPFDQYAHRFGHKFSVLRELTDAERDPEVGVMFRIRFEDGVEIDAWPEEIYEHVSE